MNKSIITQYWKYNYTAKLCTVLLWIQLNLTDKSANWSIENELINKQCTEMD